MYPCKKYTYVNDEANDKILQLKNLFKINKKKLIIELIGNPGCGKSTIVNKLKSINN